MTIKTGGIIREVINLGGAAMVKIKDLIKYSIYDVTIFLIRTYVLLKV